MNSFVREICLMLIILWAPWVSAVNGLNHDLVTWKLQRTSSARDLYELRKIESVAELMDNLIQQCRLVLQQPMAPIPCYYFSQVALQEKWLETPAHLENLRLFDQKCRTLDRPGLNSMEKSALAKGEGITEDCLQRLRERKALAEYKNQAP